mmetsp:Transcript_17745/g.26475  ORF Transcript_17745/g.26475 Transcript_17745/m.26475 type:complete len:128 (+) Transcript_17745:3211-3594(+)
MIMDNHSFAGSNAPRKENIGLASTAIDSYCTMLQCVLICGSKPPADPTFGHADGFTRGCITAIDLVEHVGILLGMCTSSVSVGRNSWCHFKYVQKYCLLVFKSRSISNSIDCVSIFNGDPIQNARTL